MKKQCKGPCGRLLPASNFYSHSGTRDRLRPKCKDCLTVEAIAWQRRNPLVVRAIQQRSELRPERKAAHAQRERNRRIRNPEKVRAVAVVNHGIRDGVLARQPCYKCDTSPAEAHHEDYKRPLDLVWACKPHHVELDKARRAALCL